MARNAQKQPVTLERLIQAQAAIAYAMTLDGAVYAPVFERLEREIAALRAADDIMERARRCLEVTPLLQSPPTVQTQFREDTSA
jgi:hypothetical protein